MKIITKIEKYDSIVSYTAISICLQIERPNSQSEFLGPIHATWTPEHFNKMFLGRIG